MTKILGLDLGTNSIGVSLRNPDRGKNLTDQLEYFSSVIFKSGVGTGKSGEFSYAAERRKKRSLRRLYQSRKYRIWATLELLINNGYCPLSIEDLDRWRKYDKGKGLKREYPIDAVRFEQWVRLDFDGDGKPDYTSPYQLRSELMNRQFDFSDELERFKLGRALYHIAQRRGFKSSKGETIQEQEKDDSVDDNSEYDVTEALKKSEEKKSGKLVEYMEAHDIKTVGCAFYELEKSGVRVRNSEYQAVRSQYRKEIDLIFEFQNGLDFNSDFYKSLVSEKKGEGTIFYKRPLRSQKGTVGYCTLEPGKLRCAVSHPEFEKFRAWCLINNIKFGEGLKEELTLEQRRRLFNDRFLLTRPNFKFEDIRGWIEKEIGCSLDFRSKTINYKDNVNVSGCPVSARLKKLLGDNWETEVIETGECKTNKKTGEIKKLSYTAYDLWHICFSFDEPEFVKNFALNKLNFDEDKANQLVRIYGAIQQGYGMLSLKAIKNINRFLEKGLMYSDAVLLAKMPEVLGDQWEMEEDNVISHLDSIIKENRKQKLLYNIANSLIANYKSLDVVEQFAYKNFDYKLDNSDYDDIKKVTIDNIGEKSWNAKSNEEKSEILEKVANLYQAFFSSKERDYYKLPKESDALASFVESTYKNINQKQLNRLYHPSMLEAYPAAREEELSDGRRMKLLGSPVIGAIKNPMAMRVLHSLRRQINGMLKTVDEDNNALIDENTSVVVETARELNDANMRWAIKRYQELRAEENKEYEAAIIELIKDNNFSGSADSKNSEDINKFRLWMELCDSEIVSKLDSKGNPLAKTKEEWKTYGYTTRRLLLDVIKCKNDVVKKYRLWKEQNFRCIYTGKTISLSQLFSPNCVDFEHTIPRSISFDDSLTNLTICDSYYNRSIKRNQIPTALANYERDANGYTAIKPRLQPWIEKVEQLKDNVAFWSAQSRKAQTKERKDKCIRQRHLWKMELDYWQSKVNRFTMTDVTSGFRNSQLTDTRIITKYAFHYLKTVFNKVEVQKGAVTFNFRKMLGVQSVDEKKSRDKHSHHAIDATMLTLIPVAAKRDKMLELFYKIQEKKRFNENTTLLERELSKDIESCHFGGNILDVVPFIENNILINHISKDQTLAPAHRRQRVRGKIIPKIGDNGEKLYEMNEDGTYKLDKHGNRIPQAREWITGDSIRGQLHKDSFFGAIKQARTDDEGKLLRDENGRILTADNVSYVIRRELKYKESAKSAGFTDWNDLENSIVDRNLFKIMKGQFSDGTSFKEACKRGFYMFKKNSQGIIDFSEKCRLGKIRHIRCKTSVKNPLPIKRQLYLSDKEYKNSYYADMGDLYVMCKYESEDRTISEYRIWCLFDVSQNRIMGLEDIPSTIENRKHIKLIQTQRLCTGDMLLLYERDPMELREMDFSELSKRLYVIRGFENDGRRIVMVRHINAQGDNVLGKGESIKSFTKMPEKIRCGINTLKFLKMGTDFHLTSRGVDFE